MKKICINIILSLVILIPLRGQTLTDSNLPIVIINTDGGINILDEPKVKATMKIIDRGPASAITSLTRTTPHTLTTTAASALKIRGSSSQESPKKSYGFTTRHG
ncbi:MAG: hypothetical protein MZV63_01555 [Marinilabiliales bacterium]|nr:hypothetical protein [Marinilabiliales bacterium]